MTSHTGDAASIDGSGFVTPHESPTTPFAPTAGQRERIQLEIDALETLVQQREEELAGLLEQLFQLRARLEDSGESNDIPPASPVSVTTAPIAPAASRSTAATAPSSPRWAPSKDRPTWQGYVKDRSRIDRTMLRSLIRQGVPLELRHEVLLTDIRLLITQLIDQVWPRCLCVHRYSTGLYSSLLNGTNVNNAPFSKQIDQDVLRTLPDHSAFASSTASGVAPLKRILVAYTRRNPSIGYCQGLGLVAAGFLINMEEEPAYWSFCSLIENFLPPEYYTPGMNGVMADQQVLAELLSQFLPKLKKHFDDHMFDVSIVVFGWFLTLFMDTLPLETVFRIWDIIFSEGCKALFAFTLTILEAAQEELLQIRDPGQLCMRLKQMTHTIYQPGPLVNDATKYLKALSNHNIKQCRNPHVQRLKLRSPRTIGNK